MAVEISTFPYRVLFHGICIECETAEGAMRLPEAMQEGKSAAQN
jgi:hypothetical protein